MSHKTLYAELCTLKSDLPLFHKSWWLDATGVAWDVAVVKKGNNIAGVWPYCSTKKLGTDISLNPALTPYLGPHVFFPADLKESRKDNYEHEVVTALIEQLPSFKLWNTALRPGLKQVGLFKQHGFDAGFRQTFLIDLQQPEDDIFAAMHEDFRRSLRKSAKEIEITNEPDKLPMLYSFQKATLDRKETGIHFSQTQMQQLFDACNERCCTTVWVARKDGAIQAILWNLWDDARAYYLVGSKNPAIKDNHAMTALIWQAVRYCKKLGKQSFDFEGSMIPGVERFFRNFGARRELYPVLKRNDSLRWKMINLLRQGHY